MTDQAELTNDVASFMVDTARATGIEEHAIEAWCTDRRILSTMECVLGYEPEVDPAAVRVRIASLVA